MQSQSMQLGTTFDIDYANYLGLNWKDSIKEIKGMNLSPIRIGVKWSRVEGKKQEYNWRDYDEILEILNSKKIPVILTVGMKSPRWPEFYIPDWIEVKTRFKTIVADNFQEELFAFIQKVISRYSKFNNIKWLQVENEPLLNSGPNLLKLSYKFLKKEVDFVRKLSSLPIILTAQGLPTTGILAEYLFFRNLYKKSLADLSDILGIHIYPKFEHKFLFGKSKTFTAGKLAWKYLEKLVNSLSSEYFCSELQAEPWQVEKVSRKDAFGNKTCNPDMVKDYLKRLKAIGFKKVLIWGTEWHLKCLKENNDLWVKEVYKGKG